MIGALWTGISGLSSQQQALDNESNNIANVNTVGFKASRISFADQMYQDRIGKGSKVLDAEKIYTQGNLRLTGVSYDMALSGNGFFTVASTSSTGITEDFYTRAGNFRMGDNGTLQDAAGNEVQGWMMTTIDPAKDVISTNPNINVFTNDYTKNLGSRIIKHSSFIETITAKATDYTKTAKGDSETIFSGAGLKTKSAKVSDIEKAIKDYAKWLQKLSEEPDGASATSTAQISHINFPSKRNDAAIAKEGDQIYVFIGGEKISQNFVAAKATDKQIAELYADSGANGARTEFGLADPSKAGGLTSDERAVYDLLASRIATYKGLADEISNKNPGLVAYVAEEKNTTGINDVLEDSDSFAPNTVDTVQMLKGIIQIKSLIPGEQFVISEVGAQSGDSTASQGNYLTQVRAQEGQGIGALESSKEALARLVTGKQRDVYTNTDLGLLADGSVTEDYTYGITIYDKELGQTIPIPNNGATPPQPLKIHLNDANSIDDIVAQLNDPAKKTYNDDGTESNPAVLSNLSDYIVAKNVNGNLVIETLDKNYDVEFTSSMRKAASNTTNALNTNALTGTFAPLDKNNNFSGREGAGAEFIEIINKVDQTATKGSLQLRLDTLGISDSAFGSFSVDSSGVIMMKQDGAEFAIGQIAIALFNNNRGLEPRGDNLMAKTNDSGEPIYNTNNDKAAKVEPKTLELSTADLSESLVNLMVFQRAFEANAKSITTSDQLLNTLINLKR